MGKRNLDSVPAIQQSSDILLTTDGNASDAERKEERKGAGKWGKVTTIPKQIEIELGFDSSAPTQRSAKV